MIHDKLIMCSKHLISTSRTKKRARQGKLREKEEDGESKIGRRNSELGYYILNEE
jgi:hypothetical protein